MAIVPSAWYCRDNATINPVTFTASQSTTTLTTTGSPALAVGMVVWTNGAVYLGVVTGGSGNSWTMTNSATVASATMVAFAGTAAGAAGWSSVAAWQASHAYTVGTLVRQSAIASVFTASATGTTTLTLTGVTSGKLAPGQSLFFAGGSTTPITLTTYGTYTGGTTGTMTMNSVLTVSSQLILSMLTPGNERVFVCTAAGTSGSLEPTWTLTRNSSTTDNTVTWREVTGQPALNGDNGTNGGVWSAGAVVSNAANNVNAALCLNTAKTHVFIVTTAGTTGGSEPTWNTTTGGTTADNTATWTCLGPVSNFPTWSAPAARLSNMLNTTWAQNNATILLGDDHVEVQPTAINITTINGTPASPTIVLSVNHATVPTTTLLAGASVTTVGPNALTLLNSTTAGIYIYGLTALAGTGATSVNFFFTASRGTLDSCSVGRRGTSNGNINLGVASATSDVLLTNCSYCFGNTSDRLSLAGKVRMQGSSALLASGSVTPTGLVNANATPIADLVACDLSSLGSSTLIGNTTTGGRVLLSGCKLGASAVLASSPSAGFLLDAINCDSAGTDYQKARYDSAGTLTTETTIVRTGGAVVDVTAVSDKIVLTANTSWINPFGAIPYGVQEVTIGSPVTVTVYGLYNGAIVPTNDMAWIDVEYAGSASSTLISIATTTKSNVMATATTNTADTSAWDSLVTSRANNTLYSIGQVVKTATNPGRVFFCTAGGTSASSEPASYASAIDGQSSFADGGANFRPGARFKMSATITPQLVGPLVARVKCGSQGTGAGFYFDPTPVLS